MDEESKIQIDYDLIAKMMAEKFVTDFMTALMPDEKTKKLLVGMMAVHRKYGIDAVTSIKIITDLCEVFKDDEEDNE